MSATFRDRVLAAIDTVRDPCSIATSRPLSIIELGLLVDLAVSDDGHVRIVLRATSPSCVLIGSILEAVDERVRAVDGVRDVQAEIDAYSLWTPELMTADGRRKLDAAREQARTELMARRPHARTLAEALKPVTTSGGIGGA